MSAEPTGDFSGEYALTLRESALEGGAASARSAVLRIEQQDADVRIQATFSFETNTSTSRSAGEPPLGRQRAGLRPPDRRHRCNDVTRRYELDESGRRLTAIGADPRRRTRCGQRVGVRARRD